jgi:hypothetical protein
MQPLVHGILTRYFDHVLAHARQHRSFGPTPAVRRALCQSAACGNVRSPHKTSLLADLAASAGVLRISHQPNILSGLNIVGLAILQAEMRRILRADGLQAVIVFVANDYDIAGDRRFRTPVVPHWSRREVVALTGAVSRQYFKRPALLAPSLAPCCFDRWAQTITQSAQFWAPTINPDGDASPEAVVSRCEAAMERLAMTLDDSPSAADSGRALLDAMLNDIFGLDVLVVSESLLIPLVREEVEAILAGAAPDQTGRLLWRVCPACFSLVAAPLTAALQARWRCSVCLGRYVRERVDFTLTVSDGRRLAPAYLPRVALQDAMDLLIYRAVGGVSYAGGIDHLAEFRLRRGSAAELPPEFAWEPDGLFSRTGRHPLWAESLDRGRGTIPFYLSCVDHSSDIVREILRVTGATKSDKVGKGKGCYG